VLHVPILVSELELTSGIQSIEDLRTYASVRMLVRYRGQPVGWVELPVGRGRSKLSAEHIRAAITDQLGVELMALVFGDAPGSARQVSPRLPTISVIICTRDRADQLEGCLDAVLTQDYPRYEVVVVDNASRTDETVRLTRSKPVRYVREETPGLNWARNRGIDEARHDIVAFVDDDARPDRGWLRTIGTAFASSDAAAVTGLVAPLELESTAQIRFELGYGGMGHGFARRIYRKADLSADGLLWASGFGVGTNMAFRREIFASIGSFDTALDVGTPSGGGGDVEMFHRLVACGYTLVYEPAVLVWHLHRRAPTSLRRLLFNNGTSFGSYLLTCARNRSIGRSHIASFFVRRWLAFWLLDRLLHPAGFPRHLVLIELLGTLVSPIAYLRTRARQRAMCAARATPFSIQPQTRKASA
jgi:glycosyltransferase involved in cell wall biosynthesis